jgi:hypothetical protein
MTLLYEAALKTNPEVEEPKDRPALINPTAGVSPRPLVGRTVWIKDDNHKDGGIWVAATEKDRLESGVATENCMLEDELEPGSEYARQWAIAKGQGVGQALPRPVVSSFSVEGLPAGNLTAQSLDQSLGIPESFGHVPSAANVNPLMNFGDMFPPSDQTVTGLGSEIIMVSLYGWVSGGLTFRHLCLKLMGLRWTRRCLMACQ